MFVRADYDQYAHVSAADQRWIPSPQAGVERVLLDRAGDEVAVATSLVRYAPGSAFPGHKHTLGEEFIVLEGEFGDEHGRHPAMSYVRNPPGTAHVPFSDPGCTIFVKLRQFSLDDHDQFSRTIDPVLPDHGWLTQCLFNDGREKVDVIAAAANTPVRLSADYFCRELLVLKGSIDWQVDVT
ncbi:MAG: cupin domain-containing protein, partial [Proteobacteria bacterium]|nr:cupin domain-containing protein [Pseudomonadota bacterium]